MEKKLAKIVAVHIMLLQINLMVMYTALESVKLCVMDE